MKITKLLFSLILFLYASLNISAQVTIGSVIKPNQGALLDLKQDNETGANSVKGIGMARVKLTKADDITADIAGVTTSNKDEHIGLLIYNTAECLNETGDGKGLYVWDGETWQPLQGKTISSGVYSFIDNRDGQSYLARNFGTIAGDWMLENLAYVPSSDDGYTNFTHGEIHSYTDKYYVYPNIGLTYNPTDGSYDPDAIPPSTWSKLQGLSYNWNAATNGENTSTSNQQQTSGGTDPITTPYRGICPENWHLPSDKEWNDLEREIYNNAYKYSNYTKAEVEAWNTAAPWQTAWERTVAYRPLTSITTDEAQGKAMKLPCPPNGSEIAFDGKSTSAAQGGFAGVLVGNGYSPKNTYGIWAYFWSASAGMTGTGAYARLLFYNNVRVGRSHDGRFNMFSVRCKRN